jgi:hypothetical protein
LGLLRSGADEIGLSAAPYTFGWPNIRICFGQE